MVFNSKIIDGQKLYFLTENDWVEIITNPSIDGVQLSKSTLTRLEKIDLPVSKRYSEIKTVGGFGGYKPFFLVYTLLLIQDIYYRVRINLANCSNCHWKGYVADPNDPEIYFGVPNDVQRQSLMRRTHHLMSESCPNCNSRISRKGIWFGE